MRGGVGRLWRRAGLFTIAHLGNWNQQHPCWLAGWVAHFMSCTACGVTVGPGKSVSCCCQGLAFPGYALVVQIHSHNSLGRNLN